MPVHIERHVFGSFKGYTTLARSAGISPADASRLEGGTYGFGQTNDFDYLSSLNTAAAYFTQALPGQRRGLTRVLQGNNDDNGRVTLQMMTAIISQVDWDNQLNGDIAPLLIDRTLWQWSGQPSIEALERHYSPSRLVLSQSSARKAAALISALEHGAQTPLVVSEAEFTYDEVRLVEALIPPANRASFTTANRTLGAQLRVSINRLASAAPIQKINFHFDEGQPLSPYAQALWGAGLNRGTVPIPFIRQDRYFGRPRPTAQDAQIYDLASQSPPDFPIASPQWGAPPAPPLLPPPRHSRRLLWLIITTATVLLLGVGLFSLWQLKSHSASLFSRTTDVPATVPAHHDNDHENGQPAPAVEDKKGLSPESALLSSPQSATSQPPADAQEGGGAWVTDGVATAGAPAPDAPSAMTQSDSPTRSTAGEQTAVEPPAADSAAALQPSTAESIQVPVDQEFAEVATDKNAATEPPQPDPEQILKQMAAAKEAQKKRDEELKDVVGRLSRFLNQRAASNGIKFQRRDADFLSIQKQASSLGVIPEGDGGRFRILFQLSKIQKDWEDVEVVINSPATSEQKLKKLTEFEQFLNQTELDMTKSLSVFFNDSQQMQPKAADLLKDIHREVQDRKDYFQQQIDKAAKTN